MSQVRSSVAELDRMRLWHPFTQQAEWELDDPLVIAAGEGSWLIDENGRRYLDGNASLWVNVHGHRRPEIDAAVREQLDRIAHTTFLGLTNPPAVAFADALLETAPPGLTRAFLSESGSSACEVAIKLALRYAQLRGETRRTRIVGLRNGYHGDTLGAVSAGGVDAFHAAFAPLLGPALHAPSPIDDPAADGLAELLAEQGDEVFAVIVEPLIQAAAGILVAPEGWLARARELCDAGRVPADLRRGGGRARSHRHVLGQRARGRRAGHPLLRQGADRRLPAALGDARARGAVRELPRRARAHLLPRSLLQREPARLRRGLRLAGALRAGRHARQRRPPVRSAAGPARGGAVSGARPRPACSPWPAAVPRSAARRATTGS